MYLSKINMGKISEPFLIMPFAGLFIAEEQIKVEISLDNLIKFLNAVVSIAMRTGNYKVTPIYKW